MAISKRVRYEVLKRDSYRCHYCHCDNQTLVIDHVIPKTLGGLDDPANLVAACFDCNAGKSSTSPAEGTVSEVSEKTLLMAEYLTNALNTYVENIDKRDAYIESVNNAWHTYSDEYTYIADDATVAVTSWYRLGIPVEIVEDAIWQACTNPRVQRAGKWHYACGIVWKVYRECLSDAADKVADEDE